MKVYRCVLVFVIALLCSGCVSGNTLAGENPGKDGQKVLPLTADQLWEAYQGDLESADQEYTGALVSVTGTVMEITEFMHKPCVSLNVSGGPFAASVICMFDGSGGQNPSCSVGDMVTIVGTCSGIHYGTVVWTDESVPPNTDYVWLSDCQLQE